MPRSPVGLHAPIAIQLHTLMPIFSPLMRIDASRSYPVPTPLQLVIKLAGNPAKISIPPTVQLFSATLFGPDGPTLSYIRLANVSRGSEPTCFRLAKHSKYTERTERRIIGLSNIHLGFTSARKGDNANVPSPVPKPLSPLHQPSHTRLLCELYIRPTSG